MRLATKSPDEVFVISFEASAKNQDNVKTVFDEVVQKILESHVLLSGTGPAAGSKPNVARLDVPKPAAAEAGKSGCCAKRDGQANPK